MTDTTMLMELPFNLTQDQLVLEPHVKGSDFGEEMTRLIDPSSWTRGEYKEEGMELIFRSTVLLKAANPEATMGECLRTAMIWYFG